jgi:hypothetical protein
LPEASAANTGCITPANKNAVNNKDIIFFIKCFPPDIIKLFFQSYKTV